MAKRALRADPLETDSLRLLALVADAKGDTSRARSLMELAAQYSKRDVRVQSWLLNQRLLDGDLDGALKSVDFMLRTWPEAKSIAEPLLVALSSDPDAVKPVVALLQTNPPWRSWFVTTFPGQVEDPAPLETFFKDLKAGPAPPTKDEVNAYLKRLVDLGEFQTAYAARVDFSSPGWVETLGQVNNGGFEQPVDGLPFGWLFANVRGADTEVVSESASNHALRVQFHNTRVPYRHVSQILLLRPGTYNLSGRVRAAALKNDRGLQWTISCYSEGKEKLGETERFSGSIPWKGFSAAFVVPAEKGCEAQLLRLELPARVPAEQDISGDIWFDDMAITRTDAVLAE